MKDHSFSLASMEKSDHVHGLSFAVVIALSLVSLVCCIVAEFRKAKVKDVKLDGGLCYIPRTGAFGFGIGGLVCLVISQIIGNFVFCRMIYLRGKRPTPLAILLLGVSWMSFGVAIFFMSTATSMNRKQPYGRGWSGGDCYIVKNGIFVVSGVLVIFAMGSTMSSISIALREFNRNQRFEIDSLKGDQFDRSCI
ncbi:hypothetical protein Droror1_Dr00025928 [Drosera rotundifolia]